MISLKESRNSNLWQMDIGGGKELQGGGRSVWRRHAFLARPLNKKKEIYIWMHPLLDLILYQSAARIKMCRILNAA